MTEKHMRSSSARRRTASGLLHSGAREREAFLRALVEESRDTMLLVDEAGRILDANRAAERTYGWILAELKTLHLLDLQADGTTALLEKAFVVARDTPALPFETIHRRKDGSAFPVEVILQPVGVNGQCYGTVAVRDITLRKKAEEALREAEAHFQGLADAAAATIFILQDEHFVEVNTAAETLTGYNREELLNLHFLQVVHPEFREFVGSRTAARFRGDNPPQRYELKILRKDGEERWIDLAVGRTTFRGRPALIDSAWDVTERKRAEAKLAQKSQLYRTLSAINQMIVREGSWEHLLSETCRILTDTGGYRLACVRFRDETTGDLMPVCKAGPALSFCMDLCGDEPKCYEATGKAVEEGRVVLVQDTQADPIYTPWRALARSHNLFAVAALPLRLRGKSLGAVNLYAGEPNAFGPEEEGLLEELARDLEYALTALEDRRERETAEGALRESERRFRLLFEKNVAGVFRTTQDGRILECNQALAHIFGAGSAEAMKGHSAAELYTAPEERRTYLAELGAQGQLTNVEWLGRKLDGTPVWILENATLVEDPNFEGPVLEGTLIDITELKEAELALRESEYKFRMLTESSAAGILMYQGEQVIYGNPAAFAMTGYSREEFLQRKFWELVHPDHRELIRSRGLARLRGEAVPSHYEFMMVTKNGEARWVDFTAGLIPFGGQNAAVIMAFDITERKKAEEQLAYLAHYDSLTGLPNRAFLYERLGQQVARCVQEKERLAVIHLGLDRFKEINDTAGHEVGDELLMETGRRLARHAAPSGEVARMGSDEFVLVLAGVESARKVEAYLQSLFESFRRPLRVKSHDFHLGFSAGVSLYPDDAVTPEDLLRCAGIAMSGAKSLGGGNVEFFTEQMGLLVSERADLHQRLRYALNHGGLEAYYQPISESASGRIVGIEALVRWRQPGGEVFLPGQFIAVTEETELILALDQWMLKTACAQRKAWNEAGFPAIPVSVNLSARQFLRPGLSGMVERILNETGLPPSQLVLEITEATAMWDAASTIPLLRELKEMGIDIAIDDFGSGYSSLMYLKQLPVRFLKIPRSFIQDLPLNLNDVAIVRAVIDMAHGLHLSVTAEGVETREQMDFLSGIGCDTVQGFYRCRPLPAASLAEYLTR